MAKAGMRRPDPEEEHSHGTESDQKQNFENNTVKPVPEIQGKARSGHEKANKLEEPAKENLW
ncbi:MAG: hypothetical protein H7X94_12370 [Vallitaleaceae bacterium]|nr:hypothetical protein [Vallitaleaceae bacterium]